MNEDINKGLVKVLFLLEPESWHGYATETLWAEHLGESQFRLRNTPFHAYGVSAEDVVLARPARDGLTFDRVVSRGGHSTYRIIIKEDTPSLQVEQYWNPLQSMGCTYEGGKHGLRAIDVPPSADINRIYELLQRGEDDDIWGFEEGHCGHAVS